MNESQNKNPYRFYIIAVIALIIFQLPAVLPADAKVNWINDYNSAVRAAKNANQMLLVQIYSETCVYCRKMESDVLNTEQMGRVCKKVKCTKLDTDADIEGIQFMRKFRIQGTPATLILDSDGGFVRLINGYIPLERFVKEIESTIAKNVEFGKFLESLKSDPKNIDAMSRVATEYYERRLFDKSLFYTDEIIKTDPENAKGRTDSAYLLKAGIIFFQLNEIDRGLKHLTVILDKWPDSKSAKPALFLKGIILIHKGDSLEGRKLLLQFKEKYQDDTEMLRRVDAILTRL